MAHREGRVRGRAWGGGGGEGQRGMAWRRGGGWKGWKGQGKELVLARHVYTEKKRQGHNDGTEVFIKGR